MPLFDVEVSDRMVYLTREEALEAFAIAQVTHARWCEVRGHYTNSFGSHLVGRLGEMAIEKFLREAGLSFTPYWRDPDSEGKCDIESEGFRIEVKTWSVAFWDMYGRCVAVSEHPSLVAKADGIAWGVLFDNASSVGVEWTPRGDTQVLVAGYTDVAQVASAPVSCTGSGEMRPVENYQLPGKSILHADVLLGRIRTWRGQTP